MADTDQNFEIDIRTRYDDSGAKEAIADQERLAGAPGGGETRQVDMGAVAAQRLEAERSMAGASAQTLKTVSQQTIELEKQLLIATRRSMLEAAINGDKAGIAKAQSELAVRQLTIQTLQSEEMTQEQINALLAEENALIEQGAVAAEARAAAEGGRLHGRAGHLGHLAENFGLDSNSAIAMGMAVMFGMEIKRLIEEATKEMDKQSELREKEGKDLAEKLKHNHEDLENARSISDVLAVRSRIEEEINTLQEKRFFATAEEKQSIDERVHVLEGELRIADNWPQANLERKNAEEMVKEELQEQTRALEAQLKFYADIAAQNKEQLKFEDELGAAKLKTAIFEIQAKIAGREIHAELFLFTGKAKHTLTVSRFVPDRQDSIVGNARQSAIEAGTERQSFSAGLRSL